MHVALYHYFRYGGDLDVWHVLLNNIPHQPVQQRVEILDGDVHWSVFRNCGKYSSARQQLLHEHFNYVETGGGVEARLLLTVRHLSVKSMDC